MRTPSTAGTPSYYDGDSASTSPPSFEEIKFNKFNGFLSQSYPVTVAHLSQSWTIRLSLEEKLHLSPSLDSFPAYLSRLGTHEAWSNVDLSSTCVLVAAFLDHLSSEDVPERVLRKVLERFRLDHFSGDDIHTLASELDDTSGSFLLRSFYRALDLTTLPYPIKPLALITSARNDDAKLQAVFGGQGINNRTCLEDLRRIHLIYASLVRGLMRVAISTFGRISSRPETAEFFETHEIDMESWLLDAHISVDQDTLSLAPVSFPMNGLISLCHYCISCKILNLTPGDLRDLLSGVAGHSQGIIIADAVARSDSWKDFFASAQTALETLFWVGYEAHQERLGRPLSHVEIEHSIASGEGRPSPMLAVRGLGEAAIGKLLSKVNKDLPSEEQVSIALVNSMDNFILAGPPKSLLGVNRHLQKEKAPEGMDQSRVLFNKRKPIVHNQFLPISAPFHTPLLENATARILAALAHVKLPTAKLRAPVFHTATATDISRIDSSDLTETLVRMVTVEKVDWPKTMSHMNDSFVLDFGPGHIGRLVNEIKQGSGTRVIMASALSSKSPKMGSKAELFSSSMPSSGSRWAELYKPRVAKNAAGGKTMVTRMTKLMHVPPVMVAGMTPTTVPWDYVAAITRAGYHVELAGGGYNKAEDMEHSIRKLSENIPAHRGITCNLLYVSPKALAWQIPLIRRLVHDGLPIEGLTIGAGVPSLENVREYVETLGLRHISFKPGSQQAILEVLSIAKLFPDFTFGLQWTGGRGGGHHSFEDFHEPILRTYAAIRDCPNVVLIAGSGFGVADGIHPYLSGEWSTAIGYSPMPFDGILLGSRMMVAKEAHSSAEAKRLMVEAEGAADSHWHHSYDRSTGGVITVISEMGQPIHKVATRGVLLWHELDKKIFSIKDPAKRLAEISKNRLYIIDRLNRDFQKPWFAINGEGKNVDLEDMTYLEVLSRLVALMYIKKQQRWVHSSYEQFVLDFLARACERLPRMVELEPKQCQIPEQLLESFHRAYPSADSEVLHPDDASFFLGLCRRRGRKPVNFVPALDGNFEMWFKKDSLWQAEDLAAVIDEDVQRVCILQGPVAVRHSRTADEPCQQILDGILHPLVESFSSKDDSASDREAQRRALGQLFEHVPKPSSLARVSVEDLKGRKVLRFPASGPLPDLEDLVRYIEDTTTGWARAFMTHSTIKQGSQRRSNSVRAALAPHHGCTITIFFASDHCIKSVTLKTSSGSPLVAVSSSDGQTISVKLFEHSPRAKRHASVDFIFRYLDDGSSCRIVEDMNGRNERIKKFYSELWLGYRLGALANAGVHREFSTGHFKIEGADVQRFASVIATSRPEHLLQGVQHDLVPMDYCIVLAWDALVKPLLISATDGDLLKLLHRSNRFSYAPGAAHLRVGDVVETIARIGSITNQPSGKLIEVIAEIRREDTPVVHIASTFFVRGAFDDHERTFRCIEEPEMAIIIDGEKTAALLQSRPWLELDAPIAEMMGSSLVFKLRTQATYDRAGTYTSLQVTGPVFLATGGHSTKRVGEVYYETGPCHGNPITSFVGRHGSPLRKVMPLSNPGWKGPHVFHIRMPKASKPYAAASKDCNPIHLTPAFAKYAELSQTVTHGMFTSAAVRTVVEEVVAESQSARFHRWSALFEDVVHPGDELRIELSHTAMVEGRMLIQVGAFNGATDAKVLEAEAEVDQPSTAYIFTGQGSQEKAMGMSLYDSSAPAEAVWERGDRHLMELYGTDSH